MARIGVRLASAGIAALAGGFIVEAGVTHGIIPDGAEARAEETSGVSVIAKTEWPAQWRHVRLASLETDAALDTGAGETSSRASFAERFGFGKLMESFGDRFNGDVTLAYGSVEIEEEASDDAASPADGAAQAPAKPAGDSSAKLASLPPASETRPRPAEAPNGTGLPTELGSRTAIYDIAAHTVYLPDGRKLEAHSGRGNHLDDPRAVTIKGRGPTPPNVYQLSLRERLFHGVRALRLTPVNEGKMFGRDGILAHTYMLGSKGASMGCVSFSNYPAFLNAYLEGKVDRLVVVDRLANPPGSKTASGGITDKLKAWFSRS